MKQKIEIIFKKMPNQNDLPLPCKMTSDSAGFDLYAAINKEVTIKPGEYKLIPTGIAVAIPSGYEGQVRPRSGLALRYGIAVLNSPGTIDSDYRGEVKAILINLGSELFSIKRGDRIAQLVINALPEILIKEVIELPDTDRGQGGFGHTGSNMKK